MSQVHMSIVAVAVAEQCSAVVSAAINAENVARDKWKKAGTSLYRAGARVEFLVRGTKDEPNPAQDNSLIETVERMIIDALTASRKPEKFITSSGNTISFTFAELVSLTRDELRDYDTKAISDAKRRCIQDIGSLFGLIRRYVDKVQNPDKARAAKSAKSAKPDAAKDDPAVILQGFVANAAKMVSASDVARFQDSLTEAIACIRRNKA